MNACGSKPDIESHLAMTYYALGCKGLVKRSDACRHANGQRSFERRGLARHSDATAEVVLTIPENMIT